MRKCSSKLKALHVLGGIIVLKYAWHENPSVLLISRLSLITHQEKGKKEITFNSVLVVSPEEFNQLGFFLFYFNTQEINSVYI